MNKERVFIFLLLVTFILLSCNILSEDAAEVVDSKLISEEETPEINSASVGKVWDKRAGPTNIDQNNAGFLIGKRIADPYVVKLGDDYHIWFTAVHHMDGKDFYTIRYAHSKDGINWYNNNKSNIVLSPDQRAGSADYNGVRVGSVLWDEDASEFKMWYLGSSGAFGEEEWKIMFARSKTPDGPWVKHPNNYNAPDKMVATPVLVSSVLDPSYTGQDPLPANSNPFDTIELGDLTVIKEKYYTGFQYYQCFKMWYTARGAIPDGDSTVIQDDEEDLIKYRISYATSGNGLEWDKYRTAVLLPNIQYTQANASPKKAVFTPFDINGKSLPVVIKDLFEGSPIYKMWYIGENRLGERALGLAYSYSGERFDFYKDTRPSALNPADYLVDETNDSVEVKEEKLKLYDPAQNPYLTGLQTIPHKGELKDPCVIRDGYVYKMWYVVDEMSGSDLVSSKLYFVESW